MTTGAEIQPTSTRSPGQIFRDATQNLFGQHGAFIRTMEGPDCKYQRLRLSDDARGRLYLLDFDAFINPTETDYTCFLDLTKASSGTGIYFTNLHGLPQVRSNIRTRARIEDTLLDAYRGDDFIETLKPLIPLINAAGILAVGTEAVSKLATDMQSCSPN